MKNLGILIFLILVIQACDPPRNCNEPKCMFTDVNAEITASLTGDLDSVLYIGDTLILSMKIPDTLKTNYGNLVFGSMLIGGGFGIVEGVGDSIIGNAILANPGVIPRVFLKYGTGTSNQLNENAPSWDPISREFVCLFVPDRKGKCIIELTSGVLNMKEIDGKEWKVNIAINLANPKRLDQYLSWLNPVNQSDATQLISKKKAWYCFEVK